MRTLPSYRRVFRVDRRIHKLDPQGKLRIPIPGGLPLRSVIYFFVVLALIAILASGSLAATALIASGLAVAGLRAGGRAGAGLGLAVGVLLAPLASTLIGLLDWPYRYLILPGLAAAVGAQIEPDGRSPHRFVAGWIAYQLRRRRTSLGRPVPLEGESTVYEPELALAPDATGPVLRRGRIKGPATVRFADQVVVDRKPRRRRRVARPLTETSRVRVRRQLVTDYVEIPDRHTLETRP